MGIIKSFLLGGCRQFVAATKRKPNIIRACVCAEHSNRYNCIYVFMHVAGRQFEKKKTIVTEHWSQHAATTAATSTDNPKHGIMRHKVPLECPGPWPKPMPMPISIPSAIRIPTFIPLPKTSCHSPSFFLGRKVLVVGQLFGCCQTSRQTFSQQRRAASWENACFCPNELQVHWHSTWPATWLTSLPTIRTAIGRGLPSDGETANACFFIW